MFVATVHGRVMFAGTLQGVAPSPSADWRVRLFTNDVDIPLDADVGLFTEATFGGYAEVVTTPGDTTGPTLADDDQSMRITGAPIDWDCSADPETIRGWFLYDFDNDKVLFAEKYEEPHVLEVGSRHRLYLDIKLGQCA